MQVILRKIYQPLSKLNLPKHFQTHEPPLGCRIRTRPWTLVGCSRWSSVNKERKKKHFENHFHLRPQLSDNMVTCRVVVVPASFPNLILETELFVIWNTCVFLLPSRQVRWERTNYRWWSRWWRPPPPSPSPSRWSSSKPPLSSPPARLPCYVLINIYQLSWAINYSPPAPLSPSLLHQPSRCCQTFNFKIIFSQEYSFTRSESLEPRAGRC